MNTPSIKEKISATSIILLSLYTLYLSIPEVAYKLTGEFEALSFLKHLAILALSLTSLMAGLRLFKKTILYETLLDTCFEEGIYQRLQPILQEIAGSQARIEELEERLDMLNHNIENFKKQHSFTHSDVGHTVNRFLRTVLLMNATLAVLLFLSQSMFYTSLTPLVLTTLYILWWLEITYEFNLWKHYTPYLWVFTPILTIPITTILADIMFGSALLLAGMGIGLVIYATTYYLWCRYRVEGVLPFKLHLGWKT